MKQIYEKNVTEGSLILETIEPVLVSSMDRYFEKVYGENAATIKRKTERLSDCVIFNLCKSGSDHAPYYAKKKAQNETIVYQNSLIFDVLIAVIPEMQIEKARLWSITKYLHPFRFVFTHHNRLYIVCPITSEKLAYFEDPLHAFSSTLNSHLIRFIAVCLEERIYEKTEQWISQYACEYQIAVLKNDGTVSISEQRGGLSREN